MAAPGEFSKSALHRRDRTKQTPPARPAPLRQKSQRLAAAVSADPDAAKFIEQAQEIDERHGMNAAVAAHKETLGWAIGRMLGNGLPVAAVREWINEVLDAIEATGMVAPPAPEQPPAAAPDGIYTDGGATLEIRTVHVEDASLDDSDPPTPNHVDE